ncbi:hypothetical protein D9613_002753 [Agrocybe pediades]|uniref:Transmembrane protein n=1 Tax=Agrocybe pediades TaxID=84607 RepID=A0A8H4QSE2_9AGAR|nr:hypothetical protein D9613_002753 [Agrocybe pediades]KAF9562201.1 hypothetical protein CPC08DRAFT_817305 [Agrocybe pediades]
MSRYRWSCLALWLVVGQRVAGQASNVTECVPDYAWSINSKGQTPCLVAAYLESQCGAPSIVNAIPVETHYLGPTFGQQNPCLCSTVTYSTISACGGCQGRTFQNWTTWSQFCVNTDIAKFPRPLPDAVEVPIWAMINVTLTDNTFNPIIAQSVLDNGSSTALPTSSSSTSTVPTTTSVTSSSLEPSTTSSSADSSVNNTVSSSSHSNHAGAIAGGVIGGLVVLIVIGLFFLWRHVQRKRNAVQRDVAFDSSALVAHNNITAQTTGNTGYTGFSQAPLVQSSHTSGPYDTPSLYTSPYGSEPGTARPFTPATTGMYTTGSLAPARRSLESVSPSMIQLGGYQPHVQQAGYRGAPEV